MKWFLFPIILILLIIIIITSIKSSAWLAMSLRFALGIWTLVPFLLLKTPPPAATLRSSSCLLSFNGVLQSNPTTWTYNQRALSLAHNVGQDNISMKHEVNITPFFFPLAFIHVVGIFLWDEIELSPSPPPVLPCAE